MAIANKQFTAGNKRRYRVDYRDWLEDGVTLNQSSGYSAALAVSVFAPTIPTDVTVSQVSVTADDLYFWVQGGSLNETFTVQTQVTDTAGDIDIATFNFTVVAP